MRKPVIASKKVATTAPYTLPFCPSVQLSAVIKDLMEQSTLYIEEALSRKTFVMLLKAINNALTKLHKEQRATTDKLPSEGLRFTDSGDLSFVLDLTPLSGSGEDADTDSILNTLLKHIPSKIRGAMEDSDIQEIHEALQQDRLPFVSTGKKEIRVRYCEPFEHGPYLLLEELPSPTRYKDPESLFRKHAMFADLRISGGAVFAVPSYLMRITQTGEDYSCSIASKHVSYIKHFLEEDTIDLSQRFEDGGLDYASIIASEVYYRSRNGENSLSALFRMELGIGILEALVNLHERGEAHSDSAFRNFVVGIEKGTIVAWPIDTVRTRGRTQGFSIEKMQKRDFMSINSGFPGLMRLLRQDAKMNKFLASIQESEDKIKVFFSKLYDEGYPTTDKQKNWSFQTIRQIIENLRCFSRIYHLMSTLPSHFKTEHDDLENLVFVFGELELQSSLKDCAESALIIKLLGLNDRDFAKELEALHSQLQHESTATQGHAESSSQVASPEEEVTDHVKDSTPRTEPMPDQRVSETPKSHNTGQGLVKTPGDQDHEHSHALQEDEPSESSQDVIAATIEFMTQYEDQQHISTSSLCDQTIFSITKPSGKSIIPSKLTESIQEATSVYEIENILRKHMSQINPVGASITEEGMCLKSLIEATLDFVSQLKVDGLCSDNPLKFP